MRRAPTTRTKKAAPARPLLGALLVERKLLTKAKLEAALTKQVGSSRSLGSVLVGEGLVAEEDVFRAIAEQLGLEFVDLAERTIDPTAAGLLNESLARRYQALPVAWEGDRLVVASAEPANVLAADDIRSLTGAELHVVVATASGVEAAIGRAHRLDSDVDDVTSLALDGTDDDSDLAALVSVTEDAPIVKLANLIIRQAVKDRASDIHIEPAEADVVVRFRIDGVLHEIMRPPKRVQAGLVSRLKIMADLNIAERRLPQDGRFSVTISGRQVDLRVAVLPTVYGEKIVLRVLDKASATLELAELGFLPETLARYEAIFRRPYGTILVTGPTGSGKSTTLYATLNQLNDPSKNIITVEDPVEYRLAGINQVQVNPRAGLTFALALRTILRADPDIVLVGEIRDRETAAIAMEAALTGHLVLTTLHTNDAGSTPTRLIEMGLAPYLVSSAVDCVVAQRLIRRLCLRCKKQVAISNAEIVGLGWDLEGMRPPRKIFVAAGCVACAKTGYEGRFALHEVLTVTEEIRALIAERAHTEDIKKMAIAQGMLTLRQAGLAHLAAGSTSAEELVRVVN